MSDDLDNIAGSILITEPNFMKNSPLAIPANHIKTGEIKSSNWSGCTLTVKTNVRTTITTTKSAFLNYNELESLIRSGVDMPKGKIEYTFDEYGDRLLGVTVTTTEVTESNE